MTITLDYTDLRFDDDRAVLLAEETDFEYDLLYARIVFRVDAADFTMGDEYTPLLDASAGLRRVVDLLPDGEAMTYESPVSWAKITFARSGDRVAISANYTEATATVGLAELKEAVSGFHQRVTRDLLVRYPGLAENPAAAKYLALDAAPGA
jgi:hypothetical protein